MLDETQFLHAGEFPALEPGSLFVLQTRDDRRRHRLFHQHSALRVLEVFGSAHFPEGHHQPAVQGPVFVDHASIVVI